MVTFDAKKLYNFDFGVFLNLFLKLLRGLTVCHFTRTRLAALPSLWNSLSACRIT